MTREERDTLAAAIAQAPVPREPGSDDDKEEVRP